MPSDHDFAKYLAIGERNHEVITLVENWCAHARVVSAGGVGLLEQMSGLPIGMRRVTCIHQRAPASASMDMRANALDYYDRNCVACSDRLPVRLPNLIELVSAREQALAAREEAQRTAQERLRLELGNRSRFRDSLRVNADVDTASVLDLLNDFDENPTPEHANRLIEARRAAPQAFSNAIVGHIAALTDVGGEARTAGALALLDALPAAATIRGPAALRALARGEARECAARIATQVLTDLSTARSTAGGPAASPLALAAELIALLPDALPALLVLARPVSSWRRWDRERDAQPTALCAAYALAPEVVLIAIRRALRSPSKEWRKCGAHSVVALLDTYGVSGVLPLVSDLIAGFAQPDDDYDTGDATHSLAWALAELFKRATDDVDPLLLSAASLGGAAERLGILRTYVATLEEHDERTGRRERVERGAPRHDAIRAMTLAYQRILDTLARLPDDQELLRIAESVLTRPGSVPPALERDAVPTLLGIAALAAAELARRDTPGVAASEAGLVDPRPAMLQHLEWEGRRIALSNLIRAAMTAVLRVASATPSSTAHRTVVELVLETLERLPVHDAILRSTLVRHLGELATDAGSAALVLPVLYRALTDSDQEVRAAAAHAYIAFVNVVGADSVPPLLHETLLVLLADPYLVVHGAALNAIRETKLPDTHLPEALRRILLVVAAHADGSNPELLDRALRAWHHVLSRMDRLTDAPRRVMVRLAGKLPPYTADDYVQRNRMHLRGAEGYGDLVVGLLTNPETFDTAHESLLDELRALEHAEIRRLANTITDAARVLLTAHPWHLDRVLQILADAGARDAARKLAREAITACGTTRDRRQQRQHAELAAALVDLEAAAGEGSVDHVCEALKRARESRTAITSGRAHQRDDDDIRRLLDNATVLD